MKNYNVKFKILHKDTVSVQLQERGLVVDDKTLTISQGLDNMLISALDKLLHRNRMGRLSLKSVEIRGKMESNRLSGMILKSVASALSA